MNATDHTELLNTQGAENFFNGRIKTGTLKVWRTQKKGPPYIKVGGRVVYRLSDLEAWLEQNRKLVNP